MKPIFDASNLCTDICKTIFVILEVQFHHEGGLSETRYFELFFSKWSIFSPYQKSASAEAPFNLSWTLIIILAIFVFWKSYETFLVQNLGHVLVKKTISFSSGVFFDWETSIYFCPLFVHFRTLWNTLTYSAVTRSPIELFWTAKNGWCHIYAGKISISFALT